MASIGIDIGTSNTVAAKVDDQGHAQVVQVSGRDLVPSVVYVESVAGRRSFGHSALDEWGDPQADPAATFRRWKLAMAEHQVLATIDWGEGERSVTPELLTTWLVQHIAQEATKGIGGESITKAVVTVPHGWRREHSAKCAATRAAAAAASVSGASLPVEPRTVDEPVAAAAYALHESGDREAFTGKPVLVIDVGGGTVDLSLVEVGGEGQPLVVVDAVNNNRGGDYATALLLSPAVRLVNESTGATIPTEPLEILRLIGDGADAWLRKAFVDAETGQLAELSRVIRTRLEQRDDNHYRSRLPGYDNSVQTLTICLEGQIIDSRVSAPQFVHLLQPFYDELRLLLRSFLNRQRAAGKLPYAVLLTGGGSNIGGIRKEVIEPVFHEFMPGEADSILTRISLNDSKLSTAVACGAALIADGRVSIEERLLYDVGLKISCPPELARELDLGDSEECVVSPILRRGSGLPGAVNTQSLEFVGLDVEEAATFSQDIVIFDDLTSPFVQTWESAHPAKGHRLSDVTVEVWADTEGALGMTVTNREGAAVVQLDGQLNRPVRVIERAGLGFHSPLHASDLPPVRTPEAVVAAFRRLGRHSGTN